jgi:hypothetical protein
MSEQIKRIYNAGIAKETIRGTKATPTFWLKPTNFNVQDKIEVVKSDRAYGRQEARDDSVIGKKYSSGSIEGEVFDKSFGLFLLGAFGEVSNSTVESGVYAHTFGVLQSSQHPSFTIVEKRGDVEQVAYTNSVIETLDLELAVNDYIKFTAGVKGLSKVADTSSVTYADENYFMAKNVTIKTADAYDDLDTGDEICVKNLKLNIVKNIEDNDCLGSAEPTDFFNKDFILTGNMEIYYSSVYERDYALNNTIKAMQITIEDTNTTIGSDLNPSLVINLAKVKFEEPVLSSNNNEIVRLVLNFEAYYSSDDELLGEAILTNTQATY